MYTGLATGLSPNVGAFPTLLQKYLDKALTILQDGENRSTDLTFQDKM